MHTTVPLGYVHLASLNSHFPLFQGLFGTLFHIQSNPCYRWHDYGLFTPSYNSRRLIFLCTIFHVVLLHKVRAHLFSPTVFGNVSVSKTFETPDYQVVILNPRGLPSHKQSLRLKIFLTRANHSTIQLDRLSFLFLVAYL